MRKFLKMVAFLLGFAICIPLLLSMTQPWTVLVYFSKNIEGTVVGANTRQPIEGVVVTASWILRDWFSSHPVKTLKASEAVTDERGRYRIPGWGPKAFLIGYLEDQEPKLRFFKPGYVPLVVDNNSVYHPGFEGDREHMIKKHMTLSDGRPATAYYEPEEHQVKFGKKSHTFQLEPFEGTEEEYVEVLLENFNINDRYISSLSDLKSGRECVWKRLPRTFIALEKFKANLDKKNIRTNYIPGLAALGGLNKQNNPCGSAEKYFKEYLE